MSIRTDLNQSLVPAHARAALRAKGVDIDSPSFRPLNKDDMQARLD
jgi:glycogen synthase kinase 3 beta